MCDCDLKNGFVCGTHAKQREEERRARAVLLNQIECEQCREAVRRKFAEADQ